MKRNIILFILSFLIGSESQAKSILLIGDSHTCETFGQTLEKGLTAKKHKVDVYCADSSSASHWLEGKNPHGNRCYTWSSKKKEALCKTDGKLPKIDTILSKKKYDQVVIALGTNALGSAQAPETFKTLAKKVKAKSKSCVWIGPPRIRADQAMGFSAENLDNLDRNLPYFYASLEYALKGTCTMVDSRDITKATAEGGKTENGVNRTPSSGTAWANSVLEENFVPRAPAEQPKDSMKILLKPAPRKSKK